MAKKQTQRDRVKAWLHTHGFITNVEAVQQGIFRLSERVRELQAEGMAITGDWVRTNGKKTGTYKYTLEGGAKPKLVATVVEVDGRRMVRFVPANAL